MHMNTKKAWLVLISTCFYFFLIPNSTANNTYSDEEVKARVVNMPLMFKTKYDEIVKSYINTYFVKARPKAGRIIGHTSMYFPIFEKYIKEKNLPEDLRFLPIL